VLGIPDTLVLGSILVENGIRLYLLFSYIVDSIVSLITRHIYLFPTPALATRFREEKIKTTIKIKGILTILLISMNFIPFGEWQ